MGRILGLDLGTNSIGWALIDKKSNEILDLGVNVYPLNERTEKRILRKSLKRNSTKSNFSNSLKFIKLHKQKVIGVLFISLLLFSSCMTIINKTDWQFWLNISMTILITYLTLLNTKDK